MVMKKAIIYKSKYGATKQYAEWIAKELGCPIYEHSEIMSDELSQFDLIIYGGSLFAGKISGLSLIKKQPNVIVFTVGLSYDFPGHLEEVIKENSLKKRKVFYFRGALDEKKLSFSHKLGLKTLKVILKGKVERTDDEKVMLDAISQNSNYIDRDAIKPLVEYVKEKL